MMDVHVCKHVVLFYHCKPILTLKVYEYTAHASHTQYLNKFISASLNAVPLLLVLVFPREN